MQMVDCEEGMHSYDRYELEKKRTS